MSQAEKAGSLERAGIPITTNYYISTAMILLPLVCSLPIIQSNTIVTFSLFRQINGSSQGCVDVIIHASLCVGSTTQPSSYFFTDLKIFLISCAPYLFICIHV